ncbi:ankyrin-1-like [Artemia franciscana]|uniref:ankyrin-1-like n=1 Tax=Artemia franciscana TaxID=6661 RepID=UPI0032D9BCFF
MFKINLKHKEYEMGACSNMEDEENKLNTSEKPNNKGTNLNVKERDKKTDLRHPSTKRTLGKCTLLLSNEVDQYFEEQGLEGKEKLAKRRKIAMFDKEEVNSSLNRAVREGDLEGAKELINSFGLSYIKEWSDGYVLLCQALINKNTAIAKLLLNHDCKVNIENGPYAGFGRIIPFKIIKNRKLTDTPLHLAVTSGDLEVIKMVLGKGADVNARNINGERPIHLAARRGHTQTVECLLRSGADVNARGIDDNSPLHSAAFRGHTHTAECLLRSGADVNARNIHGKSPLHFTASHGHPQTAECLSRCGAEVNARDVNDRSPLHVAAFCGHTQTAECLLRSGADVHARNINGERPIHLAAYCGHTQTVECLLRSGADINARGKYDESPLHLAAFRGHTETAECLLRCGAEVNAKDVNDRSPLHEAAFHGHTQTAECLLRSGAYVNARDIDSESPLHLATLHGHQKTVEYLLKSGADVNARDIDDKSPLYLATLHGHQKTVEYLLKSVADVNARDIDDKSPLHLATLHGHQKTVEYLLKSGADVNARDIDDKSPLHLATLHGHQKTVEYLLKSGADVNARDIDSESPLHLAVLNVQLSSISGSETNAVNDLASYLAYHVLKMIAANLYVSERNKSLLVQAFSCSQWGQCETELQQMKSEIIFCNISFYDIFIQGISLTELYTMNENSLKSLLKSANWEAKFPICKTIIASHFRKSIERKVLLELANRSFNFLFNRFAELPHECSEQILNYLSNENLNNLIDASELHDNS